MPRIFDWECDFCDTVRESVFNEPWPARPVRVDLLWCKCCRRETTHERIPSLFAKYTGETAKREFNPAVYGGRNDTMGYSRLPRLPELPGEREAHDEYRRALDGIADNDRKGREEVIREFDKGLPSLADYASHFQTREFKEAKSERNRVKDLNRKKRVRAGLVAKGETTIRDMPIDNDTKRIKRGST